jgi:hypothetical protein
MSKLPQIEWRCEITDLGFRLGIGGQLVVGKRKMRHAALMKARPAEMTAERIKQAADLIEGKLWTMNYYQTLREVAARNVIANPQMASV